MPDIGIMNPGGGVLLIAGAINQTLATGLNIVHFDDADQEAVIAAVQALGLVPSINTATSNGGTIAEAVCKLAVQPTAVVDSVSIGVSTYRFVASLGASIAQLQVLIGSAGSWRTALANAINNDAASKGVSWVESTIPATERFVATTASALGGVLIQNADARGGTPTPGRQNVPLSETLTAGTADGWNVGNAGGTGTPPGGDIIQSRIIGPRNLAFGSYCFSAQFRPSSVWMLAYSSAGVLRLTTDTVAVIDGGKRVKVSLAGGAPPAIQSLDRVVVYGIG